MALLRYYESTRAAINELARAAGNVINCVDTGEIFYDVTDTVRFITTHIKVYQTLDDLKQYRDSLNGKINANIVYVVANSKRFYIFNSLSGEFENILTQDDAADFINSWVGTIPAAIVKNNKRYAPMTVANTVYMQDGDTVEHKINQLGLMTSTFENIQVTEVGKTFDIPVPFRDFFNYPHCMIVCIGTTMITPNRYSVRDNKITFLDNINIGRTINFFFMYNTKPGGNALAIENIDGANINRGTITADKLNKVSNSYLLNDNSSIATSAGLKGIYDLIAALCNEKNITVRCTASKSGDTTYALHTPQGFTDLIDGDIMSIKFDSDVVHDGKITYNGHEYPIYTNSTTPIKDKEICANDELYFQFNASDNRFYVTNGMAYRMDQFTSNKIVERDGNIFSYEESGFLPGYDTLTVYLNGLKLIKNINYTIDYKAKTITLIGFNAKAGDTIEFVVDRINRTRATRDAASIDFLDMDGLKEAANEVQAKLQKQINDLIEDMNRKIRDLQAADQKIRTDFNTTLNDYATKTLVDDKINNHHEVKNIPPKIGYGDDVKAKLTFNGLNCTIASTPILIGGWTSIFPSTQVTLTANTTNYLYINRNADKTVSASVRTSPAGKVPENDTLSDTSVFENVLIAKITTNGSGMTANTIYPVGNSYLDKIYTKPLDSYPIGSIYMNVNPTDPATIFGGLWEQLPPGRVLIGQGMSDYGVNFNNGSTGGEYSHTLSQQELPSFNISGNTNRVELVGLFNSRNPRAGGRNDEGYPVNPTSGIASAVTGMLRDDGWKGDWHCGYTVKIDASHSHKFTATINGSNRPHNNMQPFLTVYMWKRKA